MEFAEKATHIKVPAYTHESRSKITLSSRGVCTSTHNSAAVPAISVDTLLEDLREAERDSR